MVYKVTTKPRNACKIGVIKCAMGCSATFLNANLCSTTARAGGRKRVFFLCQLPTRMFTHNRFCLVFSKEFNIMSALSAHQPPTLPQKIDSREGLLWCKKGVVCACGKMNFYLNCPPLTPVFRPFSAKWSTFCR